MATECVDEFAIPISDMMLARAKRIPSVSSRHKPCAPDFGVIVPSGTRDETAIRGKCHVVDGLLVSQKPCNRFCALGRIPEVHGKVVLCKHEIKLEKRSNTIDCLPSRLTEADTRRSAIFPWNLAAFSKRSFALFRLSSSPLGVGW